MLVDVEMVGDFLDLNTDIEGVDPECRAVAQEANTLEFDEKLITCNLVAFWNLVGHKHPTTVPSLLRSTDRDAFAQLGLGEAALAARRDLIDLFRIDLPLRESALTY